MKPRASAPRMIRAAAAGAAPRAGRSSRGSTSASATSGIMSLKTIPGFGKSGTSRIAVAQVERGAEVTRSLPLGEDAQLAPEEEPRELLRGLGERLQVLEPGLAPLGVARPQRRRDELLEQARLAAGRVAERAQVPGVDAVLGELPAGGRDLGVALAVEPLAALDARRRAGRTPRARARASASMPARSQSSARSSSPSCSPRPAGRRRLRSAAPAPDASSCRITRSGRNSSRCSRRIVSSRSTSSSLKSR